MDKKQVFAHIKEMKDRKFFAYASTRSLDRDGEVILPEAFNNIIEFMKNPVLLQMHDYQKPSAGKILNLDIDSKGLLFEGEFAPTDEGRMFRTLYEEEFMNAFSIGFIPNSWTEIDPENNETVYRLTTPNGVVEFNLDDYKKSGTVYRVYTDVELLEVSVVPVPANPDALQRMHQLSVKLKEWVNKLDVKGKDAKTGDTDDPNKDKELPGREIEVGDVVQLETEHGYFLTEELEGFKSFRRVDDAEVVDHKGVDAILGFDEERKETTVCYLYSAEAWTEEKATKDVNAREVEGQIGNFYAAKGEGESEGGDDKEERKRVIPYKKYPTIDRSWDAGAARKRLVSWAGGPEKEDIDFSKFRLGFGWYDESKADAVTAYKYPHHDVIDGALKTNIRGVVAAMQVVNGARGGDSLSDADRKKLYNHLAKHYRDADMEPPELKEFDDPELDPALDALFEVKREVADLAKMVSEIKEKMVPKSEGSGDPSEDTKDAETWDAIANGVKEISEAVQ